MKSTVPARRIWVVDGHPLAGSLGSALASSYSAGARQAGHEVRETHLRDLNFTISPAEGPLEPDLAVAQDSLQWCDHVVVVYPNWWGTYPALFKAFLDRMLLPGFAFEMQDRGWKGLLGGRSAQIITTMDTPFWVYRWILGAPGIRAMGRATFGFCGIKPVHVKLLGPVHDSTPSQRTRWLEQVFQMGQSVDADFRTSPAAQLKAWLSVARLQFYPFPLLVMAVGAMAGAAHISQPVRLLPAMLAGGCVFLLEFSTVLTNELEDVATDRRNRHSGLFTGGSRVLVEGRLSAGQLKRARILAGILLVTCAAGLASAGGSSTWIMTGLVLLGWLLGHQYSAKPLQLSYRGWGEVDVAFTHSFLVAGMGWVSQTPARNAGFPWGIASAIFASVLPSIILAGFPDREADSLSHKNTLMVHWGGRRSAYIAIAATGVAMILKVITGSGAPSSFWLNCGAIIHGCCLMGALVKFSHRHQDGKIDGLLIPALTFMLWFGLEPFLAFWTAVPR